MKGSCSDTGESSNTSFYICVLSYLAFEWKWGWSWQVALIETSLLFLHKFILISTRTASLTWGLSREVSIKTRSTPALLSFEGQATKLTVKWSIEYFHSHDHLACFSTKTKKNVCIRIEFSSRRDTNMAAIPLLRDANMADVMSRENTLLSALLIFFYGGNVTFINLLDTNFSRFILPLILRCRH